MSKGYDFYHSVNAEIVKNLWIVFNDIKTELIKVVKKCDFSKSCRNNPGIVEFVKNPALLVDGKEKFRWIREIGELHRRLRPGSKVADFGTLIPVVPLILKRLGYEVTCIENFELYGNGYLPIIDFCKENGIILKNIDLLSEESLQRLTEKYDGALCLAVIEHLFCGAERLFKSIYKLLNKDGIFIVDTPNASTIARRMFSLLKGENAYVNFDSFNKAYSPYTGHIFLYSPGQLTQILKNAGFAIEDIYTEYRAPDSAAKSSKKWILFKVLFKTMMKISSKFINKGDKFTKSDIIAIAKK